jgi:hypothetical protein
MTRRVRLWWAAMGLTALIMSGAVACTLTVTGDAEPAPFTGRTWGSQAHTPSLPVAENPPE